MGPVVALKQRDRVPRGLGCGVPDKEVVSDDILGRDSCGVNRLIDLKCGQVLLRASIFLESCS